MSIFSNESGVVLMDIVLVVFTVLFLFSGIVALVGHNLIASLILLLIGVTLYPAGKPAITNLMERMRGEAQGSS